MRLYNMIGYKLFKENEDGSIHMIRIVGMRRPYKINAATKDPDEITIFDYATDEKRKVKVTELKEYSPLEPDGIFTISGVTINNPDKKKPSKDVIATISKFITIKIGLSSIPFAVCRQSITDVFYNLLVQDESDMIVGLAINQETCPSNFDYKIMFAASDIVCNDYINFYRTDTLEDILGMFSHSKYDDILRELYLAHVKAVKKPELAFKEEDKGWCKNIDRLFKENNFQSDIDQMLGITSVGFAVENYLEVDKIPNKNIEYNKATDDFRYWLSSVYKVNMESTTVIDYDHDINLADFNNTRYVLIRDINNKLYLVVYTVAGEYFEQDLEEKAKEYDFSTKFKIEFYNKYNRNNKNKDKE